MAGSSMVLDPVAGDWYSTRTSQSMVKDAKESCLRPAVDGMPTETLSTFCFPEEFGLSAPVEDMPSTTASTNTSTTSASAHPKVEAEPTASEKLHHGLYHQDLSLQELKKVSDEANLTVTKDAVARQGNLLQRWAVDPGTDNLMRLVAGCVPILNDGRILVIGSSKKKEWVLPKGGWELNESLEQAAIRECFEEAGVLGILGPRIDTIYFEARKARKRRLELEEKLSRQKPEVPVADGEVQSGWSVLSQLSEDDHMNDEVSYTSGEISRTNGSPGCNPMPVIGNGSPAPEHRKNGVRVMFQISNDSEKNQPVPISYDLNSLTPTKDIGRQVTVDEGGSTFSATHTHVCMSFFPLMVQRIHDSWPEDSRARKVCSIEEAMQIVRPEFRPVLEKARQAGWHLAGNREPNSTDKMVP